MKTSDQDLQPPCAKAAGQVGSSRKLVGLNTDQRDDGSISRQFVGANDSIDRDRLDGIVEDPDPDLEIDAKHPAALQIFGEAGKAGQRVAWQDATEMADDVAFVIVLGGLDQDNGQAFAGIPTYRGLPLHGFRSSPLVARHDPTAY